MTTRSVSAVSESPGSPSNSVRAISAAILVSLTGNTDAERSVGVFGPATVSVGETSASRAMTHRSSSATTRPKTSAPHTGPSCSLVRIGRAASRAMRSPNRTRPLTEPPASTRAAMSDDASLESSSSGKGVATPDARSFHSCSTVEPSGARMVRKESSSVLNVSYEKLDSMNLGSRDSMNAYMSSHEA